MRRTVPSVVLGSLLTAAAVCGDDGGRAPYDADRHDRLALCCPPCSLRLVAGFFGQVLHPDLQLQVLADQAKARRLGDDKPAVAFIGEAREQHVEGRALDLSVPAGMSIVERKANDTTGPTPGMVIRRRATT